MMYQQFETVQLSPERVAKKQCALTDEFSACVERIVSDIEVSIVAINALR